MSLWDESMDLLGKLNRAGNNSGDFDSSYLRLEIVSLNGTYSKLSEQAKSTNDLAALSLLKLYEDRRKEFLENGNSNQCNSDELYF